VKRIKKKRIGKNEVGKAFLKQSYVQKCDQMDVGRAKGVCVALQDPSYDGAVTWK